MSLPTVTSFTPRVCVCVCPSQPQPSSTCKCVFFFLVVVVCWLEKKKTRHKHRHALTPDELPWRSGDGLIVFDSFLQLPLTTVRKKEGRKDGDEGGRKTTEGERNKTHVSWEYGTCFYSISMRNCSGAGVRDKHFTVGHMRWVFYRSISSIEPVGSLRQMCFICSSGMAKKIKVTEPCRYGMSCLR